MSASVSGVQALVISTAATSASAPTTRLRMGMAIRLTHFRAGSGPPQGRSPGREREHALPVVERTGVPGADGPVEASDANPEATRATRLEADLGEAGGGEPAADRG